MTSQRKRYNAAFKTKVALAVCHRDQTTNELTSADSQSKKLALNSMPQAFSRQVGQLLTQGGQGKIFNTDQGLPFTTNRFMQPC